MTAKECLDLAKQYGEHYQVAINAFVDEFRRSAHVYRTHMLASPIEVCGELEGLVAAVVSALCRETSFATPTWVAKIGSPTPFFAYPAKSYAMRVRLMIESPAPFLVRNVFVPENYMSRA